MVQRIGAFDTRTVFASGGSRLLPNDDGLRQFLAVCSAEDVTESGITEITSPAFAAREHGTIVSAAGYSDWPCEVAHLSVLTLATARGRGLARTVASAALCTRSHMASSPSGERSQRHPGARPALWVSANLDSR